MWCEQFDCGGAFPQTIRNSIEPRRMASYRKRSRQNSPASDGAAHDDQREPSSEREPHDKGGSENLEADQDTLDGEHESDQRGAHKGPQEKEPKSELQGASKRKSQTQSAREMSSLGGNAPPRANARPLRASSDS